MRLSDYINACRNKSFQWGEHDCGLFAANWVLAATGDDPAREWRHHYRTAIGAARKIAAHGNLFALVSSSLGEPCTNQRQACRGDVAGAIALDPDPKKRVPILGLVADHRAVFLAPKGLVFLPLTKTAMHWKVF